MNHLCNKEECCGCSSCVYVCKKNAIKMVSNKLGFLYPVIDDSICVDCGACDSICPIKNKTNSNSEIVSTIGGRYVDKNMCSLSTSGGAATYLSEVMINSGGVVYGVEYKNNKVVYARKDTLCGLLALRGTKYTEPQKDFWHLLEEDVKKSLNILFIGTPCTIAAVKKKYPLYRNLITCELICHGITSPRVLDEYIEEKEKKCESKLVEINVRYKQNQEWDPPYLKCTFENGLNTLENFFDGSTFGYAFVNMSRESCYDCKFKGNNSVADITVGDYWGIDKNGKLFTKEGVSIILLRTNKGKTFAKFNENFYVENADYQKVVENNYPLVTCTKHTKTNLEFTKKFENYDLKNACYHSKGYILKSYKILLDKLIYRAKKTVKGLLGR